MNDQFLTNYTEKTFLDKLKESLSKCSSFSFSVSFIKKAGLILFESIFEEALKRGVEGKIITSTYQNFTDIASLNTFLNWTQIYPNFECHLDIQCFGENGFHSKGYLFEYDNSYEFIVGSTNITRFALLKNIEWNVSLTSTDILDSTEEAYKEFDELWEKTLPLSQDLIKKYQTLLDYSIEKWDMDYVDPISNTIKPNAMQRKALKELRRYRDMGVSKSLVVAATGSGKTYLAAFDARNFDAKRVLYVVHRDKILVDARDTFSRVFGAEKTCGLYVGKNQDLDADFLFASNIKLSQHLTDFDPLEFDYIVLDECHHASADTYIKIMDYFKPSFLLGITATPERMDNQDVFELFDKNVPYELRLRDAIINDLVVPFHYYGIRDKLVDYGLRDNSYVAKEIAKGENIEFISKEIEKHKPSGKLKAIAFCTSIAHCKLMEEEFENIGYCALSLTGKNDLGQRIKAFNDLQDDNNQLQIICTVDILNEGVDIPDINMVLFLRPTESSTIFIQQLGRGLRKFEGKQYLTVLDFIGNNYKRSIQMAMALGTLGQTSIIEKPYLIDLIRNDFTPINIPGVVIDIDELSKEEVIDYIKNENFNSKDFLKKDYENFKKYLKLDHYPSHIDYLNSDCAPDLIRIMKSRIGKKNMSYYEFLSKIDEKSLPIFNDDQISLINKISDLLPLIRYDEYIIINQLLNENMLNLDALIGYDNKVSNKTLNNALFLLKKAEIVTNDNKLNIKSNSLGFNEYMNDLLEYGIKRHEIEFGDYDGDFKLYGNYYKEQIMRSLCKETLMFMKGTMFEDDNVTYMFVGLKKDKEKIERTNYKDKFISPYEFQWESENNTTYNNAIGQRLMSTKNVHLFVRKMDEEDGITLPFTYFGTGKLTNDRISSVNTIDKYGNPKTVPTLLFDVILDNKVPEEYYFDFEIPNDEVID